MASEGGSADTLVRCAQDGAVTRLQCRECGAPICPACYVRTAVGLRCQSCGAASGPPVPAEATSPRRGPVLAAVAVAVALVVAGVAWAATRGGGSPSTDEPAVGGQATVVPRTTLGRGELPGGMAWTLEASREGNICTMLTISPGPAAPERCEPVRSSGAVQRTSTSRVTTPAGTVYLTLGQLSDRAARVRIAPEGAPAFEVPALGGDTGLGVRFFVSHTTANVDESYTVVAADGTELGRFDRPKVPNS